ncbi:BLUF domain-containing protein [Christiangramia marina]|uniref:BLUF domain-containing protein n=1 Tax=Christiangramia marina TaxID=409436 RepID=UPI003AA7D0B3
MKYISYISQQSHILKDADMETLLNSSRKNNAASDITGLLISYQGLFIQYIEGEASTVDNLFQRIKKDPRHHSVVEISSDFLEYRQFRNWSMAFRKLSSKKAEAILGHRDLDRNAILESDKMHGKHPALKLLDSFLNNLQ